MYFLVSVLGAQDKRPNVAALSEPALGERGEARILYWNQDKDQAVAAVTIDFGRPMWNKEYDDPARFGLATKGKVWRLGSNYWTILDTNVPLRIAGRDIPVGLWYLGLHRSEDGSTWSLAFIDPIKARRSRLDAYAMNTVPTDFKIPMVVEQATDKTEKLVIALSAQKENTKNLILRISWGRLQLMTPIQVVLEY
jgi:hypothetical protein